MASFGDILSSLGSALETGANYGMQQMGAQGAQAPQLPPPPQPQPAPGAPQTQDDTKQPYNGAPGMSRLNILQFLLGMRPLTPQQNLIFPFDNYLGRIGG